MAALFAICYLLFALAAVLNIFQTKAKQTADNGNNECQPEGSST